MDETALHAALRYFPLTGRPRPACGPLPGRVAEVTAITLAARHPGADVQWQAAHALNKAALIASDCGEPDLARQLCWRHITSYPGTGRPLTIREARGILEPVLNLARLAARTGALAGALELLSGIHQAITFSQDLVVDGSVLPLGGIAGTRDQHRQLRQWAWLQHITEGIRACVLAGDWPAAVSHAESHRGIGAHLLEGRQAAIITPLLAGDACTARALLAESTVTEPWEHAVAACLAVMCADDDDAHELASKTALGFRTAGPAPGYAPYRARLGLTILTLALHSDPASASRITDAVTAEAIASADGSAARELLTHPASSGLLSPAQRQLLAGTQAASGVRAGSVPEPHRTDLLAAASAAEAQLRAFTRSGCHAGS
jgi:hypothetical protein